MDNNAEEIAHTKEMLYTNTSLRKLIADNAAKDVRRFGCEEIMQKIKEIFEK